MENTSGQGAAAVVPAEVDRWNWGAFLMHWIWGIGNNTYIALLMFVPFVNIVMPFVLGAKGSVWAWRNDRWKSVEHFRHVQRLWAIWSVVAYLAMIGVFAAMFFFIAAGIKSSEAYRMGVARVEANAQAMSILGAPIASGFPTGSIEVSGPKGKADISFSVTGSKASGTVYLDAVKDLGAWKINRLELEVQGRPERIDLLTDRST